MLCWFLPVDVQFEESEVNTINIKIFLEPSTRKTFIEDVRGGFDSVDQIRRLQSTVRPELLIL